MTNPDMVLIGSVADEGLGAGDLEVLGPLLGALCRMARGQEARIIELEEQLADLLAEVYPD